MKQYTLNHTTPAALRDGSAWQAAPELEIACYPWDETGYRPRTTARLVWLDDRLAVRFCTRERALRAEARGICPVVCEDSAVELFLMVIARPRNVPFDQYPRSVVKRAAQYLRETGIADEMIIGPEFEFYLFDDVYFETGPSCVRCEVNAGEAAWNSGHAGDGSQIPHKGGYHIDIPHDSGSDLRSTMGYLDGEYTISLRCSDALTPVLNSPGTNITDYFQGPAVELFTMDGAPAVNGNTVTFKIKGSDKYGPNGTAIEGSKLAELLDGGMHDAYFWKTDAELQDSDRSYYTAVRQFDLDAMTPAFS